MVGERRNAKRLPPPLADGLDQGVEPGTNSRTSCAQRQATAILPAHSSASSREGTSTTENPPMYAFALRVWAVGDRPVRGHHAHLFPGMQPAAEHPNAGVLCLLHHRVRCLGHVGEVLRGKRRKLRAYVEEHGRGDIVGLVTNAAYQLGAQSGTERQNLRAEYDAIRGGGTSEGDMDPEFELWVQAVALAATLALGPEAGGVVELIGGIISWPVG